jgi:hypothetical protein
LFTAQKVQEDGTVIAAGFGNRARTMVEDVYGQVRPAWRHQANAMIPARQAVSPFRHAGTSSSPVRKAGSKQPYGFATPPRTGAKLRLTDESPRFGAKKGQTTTKGVQLLADDESSEISAPQGITIATIVPPRDPNKPKKPKKAPMEKGKDLKSMKTGGYYASTRGSTRDNATGDAQAFNMTSH